MDKSMLRSCWLWLGAVMVLAAASATTIWSVREMLKPVPVADTRLIGKWIHDVDRTPLEFQPDGTVEVIVIQTSRWRENGIEIGESVHKEIHSTGQYRWVSRSTIEMIFPEYPTWDPVRVVIEGHRLTLLRNDGSVERYLRAK